jgi:hypothetical protein
MVKVGPDMGLHTGFEILSTMSSHIEVHYYNYKTCRQKVNRRRTCSVLQYGKRFPVGFTSFKVFRGRLHSNMKGADVLISNILRKI